MSLSPIAAPAATSTAVGRRGFARSGQPPKARSEPLLFLASLSFVLATIHAVATVSHMSEYPPYGVLFAALATFQLVWGVRVYGRPSRSVLALGTLVNTGIIAVWLISRTLGLPFGPHGPGVPESVGLADLAAMIDELSLITFVWRLSGAAEERRLTPLLRQVLIVLLVFGSVGAMSVGHAH